MEQQQLYQRAIWICSILLCSLLISACGGAESSDPKTDIIGKWQTSDKVWTMEFKADGDYSVVYDDGRIKQENKIQAESIDDLFVDDTHILGHWDAPPRIWELRIRGDTLTLVASDGEKLQLKRSETPEGEIAMPITLTSTAFTEGGTIPKKFTCDEANVSPALAWTGIPAGTRSLVLIADDPDCPVGTWVHWVLYDLPADLTSLPEGTSGLGTPGMNDFRRSGYGGPCPPKGSTHRYYFKIYAMDTQLNLKSGASKADVEKAMKGHILAQGQLMGKYGR